MNPYQKVPPLMNPDQEVPPLMNPSGTITISGNSYDILSKCTDEILLQHLIVQNLLPGDISLLSYFRNLHCKTESYVVNTTDEIQKGGSNVVYKLNETQVIRIGINKDRELPDYKLKGFIIQAYLSQFCKNICKVYDFGIIDFGYGYGVYAVLEQLGPDFMTEYENGERYSIDTIIRISQDILEALNCIHSMGYIHCDVKLENMAERISGEVCLFDFDDAIYLPDKNNMYVQIPTKGIGTTVYWAPEICLPYVNNEGKMIDCNPTKPIIKHTIYADIYACGICLKNLLEYLFDKNTGDGEKEQYEYMKKLVDFMCAPVFIKVEKDKKEYIKKLEKVNFPISDKMPGRFYRFSFLDDKGGRLDASKALEYIKDMLKYIKQSKINSDSNKKQRLRGGKTRRKNNMDPLHVPKRYIPATLTRRDLAKQRQYLRKSRKLYKKGMYYQRPKVSSFHSRKSRHLAHAERMYGVDHVAPNAELAKKTRCSIKALEKIVNKGRGAYYSSGSRPNQTAESWGIARLASALTGGNASVVDLHILEEGCKPDSQALTKAKAKAKSNP